MSLYSYYYDFLNNSYSYSAWACAWTDLFLRAYVEILTWHNGIQVRFQVLDFSPEDHKSWSIIFGIEIYSMIMIHDSWFMMGRAPYMQCACSPDLWLTGKSSRFIFDCFTFCSVHLHCILSLLCTFHYCRYHYYRLPFMCVGSKEGKN